MTAIGITHRPNRKPNGITKADREARKSDDQLKRDFKSDKPFSKCVTDITEVKAKNGKLYVSATIWNKAAPRCGFFLLFHLFERWNIRRSEQHAFQFLPVISADMLYNVLVGFVFAQLHYTTKKGCIIAFFAMQPFLLFFYSAILLYLWKEFRFLCVKFLVWEYSGFL